MATLPLTSPQWLDGTAARRSTACSGTPIGGPPALQVVVHRPMGAAGVALPASMTASRSPSNAGGARRGRLAPDAGVARRRRIAVNVGIYADNDADARRGGFCIASHETDRAIDTDELATRGSSSSALPF
jgi:hypothetical protein